LIEIVINQLINPLECKGNYSATSNTNMKLIHWPLIGGLYQI